MQETQLAGNVVTTHLYQRIVLRLEPPESLPVHRFGLAAIAVSNARHPAQPFSDPVGLPR